MPPQSCTCGRFLFSLNFSIVETSLIFEIIFTTSDNVFYVNKLKNKEKGKDLPSSL